MFENRFKENFLTPDAKPTRKKLETMNRFGFESIKAYENIEKILLEQQKELKDIPKEHYQSIINTRFNIAKAYNKIFLADKREKVELMSRYT